MPVDSSRTDANPVDIATRIQGALDSFAETGNITGWLRINNRNTGKMNLFRITIKSPKKPPACTRPADLLPVSVR
jgi:hypothetical protein